jgi:hypothetical protein
VDAIAAVKGVPPVLPVPDEVVIGEEYRSPEPDLRQDAGYRPQSHDVQDRPNRHAVAHFKIIDWPAARLNGYDAATAQTY